MGVLKKAGGALSAFGAMARRALSPTPVELPVALFPTGDSRAWESLMREMGIQAVSFKPYRWSEDTMGSGKFTVTGLDGVFELDTGEKEKFRLKGEMAWLGEWAHHTGLRLELKEQGARWVAPSAKAAGKTRWARALEEPRLEAAAAEAREECAFAGELVGRCERIRNEKFLRDNPEQFEEWKNRQLLSARPWRM